MVGYLGCCAGGGGVSALAKLDWSARRVGAG